MPLQDADLQARGLDLTSLFECGQPGAATTGAMQANAGLRPLLHIMPLTVSGLCA